MMCANEEAYWQTKLAFPSGICRVAIDMESGFDVDGSQYRKLCDELVAGIVEFISFKTIDGTAVMLRVRNIECIMHTPHNILREMYEKESQLIE